MVRPDAVRWRFRRSILRLLRRGEGNSAVEFALIAPVLVLLLIGLVDIGRYAYERADMFGAVRAGAQYFMAGGGNTGIAQGIVLTSWSQMPGDGLVEVDRFCQCAGIAMSCHAPCPDGEPPAAFNRIVASATFDGILVNLPNATTEVIRVR
jgi:Flp pilus assembly pilin Flp